MNRIDLQFQQLRQQGRKAFIGFLTAGDPELETTAKVLEEFSRRGVHLIEIGFPYSDPIADGPVIQASYTRALAKHLTVKDIFDSVERLVQRSSTQRPLAPLVAMVSYAIVYRHGAEKFVSEAKCAGFEGAIVPDLPVEECDQLRAIASSHDFKLILLVTPTTPRERAAEIARASSGFLYYVSVVGITGERDTIPASVVDQARWLRTQTELPLCIGFGIGKPEHVRMLAPVADGVIVGSAIVRRIAAASGRPRDELAKDVGEYIQPLIDALERTT